jgi:dipeptidyl aminopeptidase/acylaminoacyl peptidase
MQSAIQKDVRGTALYREAEELYQVFRQPGTGRISDAADIHVSSDGKYGVFAGTIMDALHGAPPTRICRVDLASGETSVLTFGPNIDRAPKVSPDGRHIAFLSDRRKAGNFQLYLLDPSSGAAKPMPEVDGWVEYLHWSPDGQRILLGVAGHGADVAGGQGAVVSKKAAEEVPPSWMPAVETGDESYRWRHLWVYEIATNRVHRVSKAGNNVWEAAWCGNEALAAVTSPGPGEGLWYSARVNVIQAMSGEARELYVPREQIGCVVASSDGKHIVVVEAVCSDRLFVAGDLRLIERASGAVRHVDTQGLDVTYAEWRSDRHLLIAGHREFDTVVAVCDIQLGSYVEVWVSRDITAGFFYASVAGIGSDGDFLLVGRTFTRGPELAIVHGREYRVVRSLDHGYADAASVISAAEPVSWRAPDGLEIQGWLLRPRGEPPHPLVMSVHGGPVWHWRPLWLGPPFLMLLKRGYAVFQPNPRGSSGRGQEFIRRVVGDMGGADTYDYLSGLDHLVHAGIADRNRLGVTGASYGGYISSWLITQDPRFAAAVPISPVTNNVTEHLIGNIPHFVSMFLADRYTNPTGKYFSRSPVMHAHKAKTPTLNICGALDRCTPPEEAMQFHSALLENGTNSALVTYPEEGHGVRKLPAAIDCAARIVAWFEEHMGSGSRPRVA